MARTIRNAGSAPIYRETENLMLLCIEWQNEPLIV